MEFANAFVQQVLHLLDGDTRSDEAAGFRIVIETVETVLQPLGDRRATTFRESQNLWEAA